MAKRQSVFVKKAVTEIDIHGLNHMQAIERNFLLVILSWREGWKSSVLVEVKGRNYLRYEGSAGPQLHLVSEQDQKKVLSGYSHKFIHQPCRAEG